VRLLDPVSTAPRRPLLVGHAITFDLKYLVQAGLWAPDGSKLFDTMYAELLPEASAAPRSAEKGWYGLKSAARRYCHIDLAKEEQQSDWGVAQHSQEQLDYARRDAAAVLPLYAALSREITRAGMDGVWALEMRALPCVVWTELSGMPIDIEGWLDITSEMKLAMEEAEKRLNAYVTAHLDMDAWRARISQSVKDESVRTATGINWNAAEQVKAAFWSPEDHRRLLREVARHQAVA
jgi:ribonuclease D